MSVHSKTPRQGDGRLFIRSWLVEPAASLPTLVPFPNARTFPRSTVQNLTRSAKFKRFSVLRRSGLHPGTSEPAGPVLPPGGVTPPAPAK